LNIDRVKLIILFTSHRVDRPECFWFTYNWHFNEKN